MKKFFKTDKGNLPLYITAILFAIVLMLWFFPKTFGLVSSDYDLNQFRSNLKDLAQLFYILVTLWLVLVTRKMAEISLNSQKAFNRPEIMCELFISSEKPSINNFTGIKNVEIRNTTDSEYDEELLGAKIFLVVKNRYGGGKAINISTNSDLEVRNPERVMIPRNVEIDYLAEGDCVCFYLYRFERPSLESCSIKLNSCILKFTTPFNEASKEAQIELIYNQNNNILAIGNHIGAIKLESGIRTNQ